MSLRTQLRRRKWRAATLALAAVLAVSGCGDAEATADDLDRLEQAYAAADPVLGEEVFADGCSVCHGRDGGGGVGAALDGVSERLSVRDHLSVVWSGRGSMPPFGGLLTDAQIASVVAYQRNTFSPEQLDPEQTSPDHNGAGQIGAEQIDSDHNGAGQNVR